MEKDIFNIDKNKLSYGRGYVYSLQYHLVWCTKYRKKVLKNGIDTECKEMLQNLAEEYKFQILAMEVMPDHIHLLVDCKPQFYISDIIKIMKGNLARQMFLAYPELKKELWGGHLWNPSYCAITVSDRSRDQVLAYIHRRTKGKRKEKSLTEEMICWRKRAEYVQAIGFKFTIYRKNLEEPKILFPGQVAKKKVQEEGTTKKGRPTKRSRR